MDLDRHNTLLQQKCSKQWPWVVEFNIQSILQKPFVQQMCPFFGHLGTKSTMQCYKLKWTLQLWQLLGKWSLTHTRYVHTSATSQHSCSWNRGISGIRKYVFACLCQRRTASVV
jgi:hypothetical protein